MLVALAVVSSLLAVLFVVPLWAFIDAAGRQGKERAAWLIAIGVLWPFGSIFYALVHARGPGLRTFATVVVIVNAALVWIGHTNSSRESPGGKATIEHYEAVRHTSTLELTHVLGSYGEPGNDDYVHDLSVSSDGSRVAVSGGRTLRLWDITESRVLRTHEELPTNDILAGWLHGKWLGRGRRVALSPDGTMVAAERGSVTIRLGLPLFGFIADVVRGRGHMVELWSDEDEERMQTIRAHASNITYLDFVDDELATASYDGALIVWDAASVTPRTALRPGRGWIGASAVSRDKTLALVSAHDPYAGSASYLALWDLTTGAERVTLAGHDDRARTVAFTPDGQRALSASFDGFRIWSVETGDELRFVPGNDAVFDAAFSPDGRYALAGATTIYLWDLELGDVVDEIPLRRSDDRAEAFVFAHDGSFVLIGTSRGAILRYRWKEPGVQSPEARETEPG